jgi:hypothetical protein
MGASNGRSCGPTTPRMGCWEFGMSRSKTGHNHISAPSNLQLNGSWCRCFITPRSDTRLTSSIPWLLCSWRLRSPSPPEPTPCLITGACELHNLTPRRTTSIEKAIMSHIGGPSSRPQHHMRPTACALHAPRIPTGRLGAALHVHPAPFLAYCSLVWCWKLGLSPFGRTLATHFWPARLLENVF